MERPPLLAAAVYRLAKEFGWEPPPGNLTLETALALSEQLPAPYPPPPDTRKQALPAWYFPILRTSRISPETYLEYSSFFLALDDVVRLIHGRPRLASANANQERSHAIYDAVVQLLDALPGAHDKTRRYGTQMWRLLDYPQREERVERIRQYVLSTGSRYPLPKRPLGRGLPDLSANLANQLCLYERATALLLSRPPDKGELVEDTYRQKKSKR